MTIYQKNYAKYYDTIHSDKDYKSESDFIINVNKKYGQLTVEKIVDIGCGTGRHAAYFARLGYDIVGVDPSEEMVNIANQKFGSIPNCRFIAGYVSDLHGEYQLAISMFNVINHINALSDLIDFYKATRRLLVKDALLIFDCWNGVAALRDPPRNRDMGKITERGKILRIVTSCETSLMHSQVIMKTFVEYDSHSLKYELEHTLWCPKTIKDSLFMADFQVIDIFKSYELASLATENDYKIAFVCRAV